MDEVGVPEIASFVAVFVCDLLSHAATRRLDMVRVLR